MCLFAAAWLSPKDSLNPVEHAKAAEFSKKRQVTHFAGKGSMVIPLEFYCFEVPSRGLRLHLGELAATMHPHVPTASEYRPPLK